MPVQENPPIVSALEWNAERERVLEAEKMFMRARDVLTARRRCMPWMVVGKPYISVVRENVG